jgi:hypothetical protein
LYICHVNNDNHLTAGPVNAAHAMTTYIIVNDRYSNQPDEVTFSELEGMADGDIREGQTTTADRQHSVDCVKDYRGEVVAVEKSAYESGDFIA